MISIIFLFLFVSLLECISFPPVWQAKLSGSIERQSSHASYSSDLKGNLAISNENLVWFKYTVYDEDLSEDKYVIWQDPNTLGDYVVSTGSSDQCSYDPPEANASAFYYEFMLGSPLANSEYKGEKSFNGKKYSLYSYDSTAYGTKYDFYFDSKNLPVGLEMKVDGDDEENHITLIFNDLKLTLHDLPTTSPSECMDYPQIPTEYSIFSNLYSVNYPTAPIVALNATTIYIYSLSEQAAYTSDQYGYVDLSIVKDGYLYDYSVDPSSDYEECTCDKYAYTSSFYMKDPKLAQIYSLGVDESGEIYEDGLEISVYTDDYFGTHYIYTEKNYQTTYEPFEFVSDGRPELIIETVTEYVPYAISSYFAVPSACASVTCDENTAVDARAIKFVNSLKMSMAKSI